ncbi:MAG: hypothetical protein WA869_03585, partial [Alloacidobacterium sp.]
LDSLVYRSNAFRNSTDLACAKHRADKTGGALCGRTDHLYLTGLVEQFCQVLGSQGLVFDNNGSDPDPHENKS